MSEPADDTAPQGPSSRLVTMVVIPVLVFLGGFILVLATTGGAERGTYSALVGRQAPTVSGPTIDGDRFALPTAPGQYVIVNFFATWCVPCIQEHPELVNFSERHGRAGDATVVSIVYDSRPEQVRKFFDDNGGDWPVVIDPDGRIALEYGVSGVPESYVVAPDGVVLAKLIGGVTSSELDAILLEVSGR